MVTGLGCGGFYALSVDLAPSLLEILRGKLSFPLRNSRVVIYTINLISKRREKHHLSAVSIMKRWCKAPAKGDRL
ncbi:hypothetical protein [Anabaena sp. 4-3]|uniref:hypothetical protein n=1 Tax=Anabaena sp. 4-3 TaxID=1811979 RepID=UPI000ADC675B|nr:hypothetical protein [Anabaena sp. 4-3]